MLSTVCIFCHSSFNRGSICLFYVYFLFFLQQGLLYVELCFRFVSFVTGGLPSGRLARLCFVHSTAH